MKILHRYIAKTVLSAILMVTLVVIALSFVIDLLGEFRDIGIKDYGFAEAIVHSLLLLPYNLYQFFPMVVLLGGVFGLGMLASHQELTVMRASGLSFTKIIRAVISGALIFILFISVLGEGVAPKATFHANKRKSSAESGGQAVATASGVWIHEGNNFYHIKRVIGMRHLEGVTRYQFDAEHHLLAAERNLFSEESVEILVGTVASIKPAPNDELKQLQPLIAQAIDAYKEHENKNPWKMIGLGRERKSQLLEPLRNFNSEQDLEEKTQILLTEPRLAPGAGIANVVTAAVAEGKGMPQSEERGRWAFLGRMAKAVIKKALDYFYITDAIKLIQETLKPEEQEGIIKDIAEAMVDEPKSLSILKIISYAIQVKKGEMKPEEAISEIVRIKAIHVRAKELPAAFSDQQQTFALGAEELSLRQKLLQLVWQASAARYDENFAAAIESLANNAIAIIKLIAEKKLRRAPQLREVPPIIQAQSSIAAPPDEIKGLQRRLSALERDKTVKESKLAGQDREINALTRQVTDLQQQQDEFSHYYDCSMQRGGYQFSEQRWWFACILSAGTALYAAYNVTSWSVSSYATVLALWFSPIGLMTVAAIATVIIAYNLYLLNQAIKIISQEMKNSENKLVVAEKKNYDASLRHLISKFPLEVEEGSGVASLFAAADEARAQSPAARLHAFAAQQPLIPEARLGFYRKFQEIVDSQANKEAGELKANEVLAIFRNHLDAVVTTETQKQSCLFKCGLFKREDPFINNVRQLQRRLVPG
jgi:hypothetical protein